MANGVGTKPPGSPMMGSKRSNGQSVQFRTDEPSSKGSFSDVVPRAQPFDERRFRTERKLQDASRNEGAVNLMRDMAAGGGFVAVKQMPLAWTQKDPASFAKVQPDSSERPWYDIAIVSSLNEKGCAFVCKFIGVFLDQTYLYVVCSLATEGDLFDWCSVLKDPPGLSREAAIQPVVKQLAAAMKMLHNYGICHRDLSMENVLLHQEPAGLFVKLIDFGMSTTARNHRDEVRGKYPYQAPEMHRGDGAYDGFLTDTFAFGVVVFCLAVKDYPWRSTKPGTCKTFDLAAAVGLPQWLPGRKLPGSRGKRLADALTKPLAEMLQGVLDHHPQNRLTLGERSWRYSSSGIRPSVWAEDGWLGLDEDNSGPVREMSWKSEGPRSRAPPLDCTDQEEEDESLVTDLANASLSPVRRKQPQAKPGEKQPESQNPAEQLAAAMAYDDGCLTKEEKSPPSCVAQKSPPGPSAEPQKAAAPAAVTPSRDDRPKSPVRLADKGFDLKFSACPPRMVSFAEASPEFDIPAFSAG